MYNYEKEAKALKALGILAKKVYSEIDPIVKDTMHSLAKDSSSTLTPDELIVTSHKLMGTPMSPELTHIVDQLKQSRSAAKSLEGRMALPAAPSLVPGGAPLPAVTAPAQHTTDAILNTSLMSTIQQYNTLTNSKAKLIAQHRAIKVSGQNTKDVRRKLGKQIKSTDVAIKNNEKKLQDQYARMRYNKLKEEFGL